MTCCNSSAAVCNARHFQVVREGVLIPQQPVSVVLSLAPGKDPALDEGAAGKQPPGLSGCASVFPHLLSGNEVDTVVSSVTFRQQSHGFMCFNSLSLIPCSKCCCLYRNDPSPQVSKHCIELCFFPSFSICLSI